MRRLKSAKCSDHSRPLLGSTSRTFFIRFSWQKIFLTIDLVREYHQIFVNTHDIPKTAITTFFGLFEYTHMSCGLRNASQTFQRFINEVTRRLDIWFVYIDDVLVASENSQQHQQHLKQLLTRFSNYGVVINLSKCKFGQPKVTFLGYHICASGTQPPSNRVQAIFDIKKRPLLKNCRGFLVW